jgi:prepilin-type N-terminal cleavage/methylation domain-containing protein
MPISSVGKTSSAPNSAPLPDGRGSESAIRAATVRERCLGVTLIEMLVVVAIIGLIAAISYPSAAAGIESARLLSACDSVAVFLNSAVNLVERRQQPLELIVSPKEGRLTMYSNQPGFTRELQMPEGIAIEAVLPAMQEDPEEGRRLILMPGATVPGIGIQLGNRRGARRIVRLDPMTGFPRVESVTKE